MAKVTRRVMQSHGPSGFFYGAGIPHHSNKEEKAMKEVKKVIAYRRRCRELGAGTGLSHYILLTPKPAKAQ